MLGLSSSLDLELTRGLTVEQQSSAAVFSNFHEILDWEVISSVGARVRATEWSLNCIDIGES